MSIGSTWLNVETSNEQQFVSLDSFTRMNNFFEMKSVCSCISTGLFYVQMCGLNRKIFKILKIHVFHTKIDGVGKKQLHPYPCGVEIAWSSCIVCMRKSPPLPVAHERWIFLWISPISLLKVKFLLNFRNFNFGLSGL